MGLTYTGIKPKRPNANQSLYKSEDLVQTLPMLQSGQLKIFYMKPSA